AHVGSGAIAVVGQRLDDDRHATRAIALIADFVIVLAVRADRLLDGAIDIVLGHGLGARVDHRQAQTRIERGVGHAHLGSNGDFARQLGKDLRAYGVALALAVHDVFGVGMAGHGSSSADYRFRAAYRGHP